MIRVIGTTGIAAPIALGSQVRRIMRTCLSNVISCSDRAAAGADSIANGREEIAGIPEHSPSLRRTLPGRCSRTTHAPCPRQLEIRAYRPERSRASRHSPLGRTRATTRSAYLRELALVAGPDGMANVPASLKSGRGCSQDWQLSMGGG